MAKSFKRQNKEAEPQFYCEVCEEWRPRYEFTDRTLYKVGWASHEYQGDSFYEDPEECLVWTCDHCGEVVAVDDAPQTRQFSEVWVCGDCKEEHDDYEDAQECCT